MTSQEKLWLRTRHKLGQQEIDGLNGLWWSPSYKQLDGLLKNGITAEDILIATANGSDYNEIKSEATKNRLDHVESSLFKEPLKIKGDTPVHDAFNVASTIANGAGWLVFKIGRAIVGR